MQQNTQDIVEADKRLTFKVATKAHAVAELKMAEFVQADEQARAQQSFEPIEEFLRQTVASTKTFGLARALVEELTGLTEQLNNSLDKTKPLFGKVDQEKHAKAETFRSVYMAHFLREIVNELNKELNEDV